METTESVKTRNEYFPDMRNYIFPRRVTVDDYYYESRDIVSFGVPLTLETVREAYHKGIFPWEVGEDIPLPWYCPEYRAILDFADLKIPRSLRREWQKTAFTFTIDREFSTVIRTCSAIRRKGQRGPSWITPEFIRVYEQAHVAGLAHSVEVWDGDNLIGGLYGIDAGGVFTGESMFHLRSYASKFAVLFLIEYLKERGATWLDIETMTPHFEMLGAKEIPRMEFLDKLKMTQESGLKIF